MRRILTATEIKDRYAVEFERAKAELMNFDVPAQRTINRFFEEIGQPRLRKYKGGYLDRWDELNGEVSQVIPSRIAERWMQY